MGAIIHVRGVGVPLHVQETPGEILELIDGDASSGVPSAGFVALTSHHVDPAERKPLHVDRFSIAAIGHASR